MNKPWEINSKAVLVLSDVHQDLKWIKDVLELEKGNYDKVLLNGDIIHARKSLDLVVGTRETARYYKWLLDNHNVNLGNHELPIIESFRMNVKYRPLREPHHRMGGWTKSSTLHFNREMTRADWDKVTLFRVVNGVLVSHAGIHPKLWDFEKTPADNLQKLWDEGQRSIQELLAGGVGHRIFEAGPARYRNPWEAKVSFGGPVWLDWNSEFQEGVPFAQLVGHTAEELTIRQKGKSFNIDGKQTTYAIITEDGTIKFGAIRDGRKINPIFA